MCTNPVIPTYKLASFSAIMLCSVAVAVKNNALCLWKDSRRLHGNGAEGERF